MDFWEKVARLLAQKWAEDADPDDLVFEWDGQPDTLLEWAAKTIEAKEV